MKREKVYVGAVPPPSPPPHLAETEKWGNLRREEGKVVVEVCGDGRPPPSPLAEGKRKEKEES